MSHLRKTWHCPQNLSVQQTSRPRAQRPDTAFPLVVATGAEQQLRPLVNAEEEDGNGAHTERSDALGLSNQ